MLWTAFCNSDWHDWRGTGKDEDRLAKPGWIEGFCERWHLAVPAPPTAAEIDALRALRNRLRTLAQTMAAGGAPTSDDMAELNRVMAAGPVIRHVNVDDEGHRLEVLPLRQDWPQVMADIAASFARTLVEGETARVRICDNPDCLWVFYDDTRNRTKRFCDDKACGNLMKVRRFRARKKAAPEQEGQPQ